MVLGRNLLSQYGAVDLSGVRHSQGSTALGSVLIIDGMDTRAELGFRMVFVDTLNEF
jgi:hypothetical protein